MNMQKLEAVTTKVNCALKMIIALFIAVMTLLVTANVFSRYVFHFSLTWSSELAQYCMIWAAFLGAAVLVNMDEHLAVDLLEKSATRRARSMLRVFVRGGSMVFFIILIYYGIILVKSTSGQVAASMGFLPMNLVYLVIPLSGLIMFLGSAVSLLRVFREENEES
ncbi:TRAP transporter small permease [Candidatus Poribacteria bacterium]